MIYAFLCIIDQLEDRLKVIDSIIQYRPLRLFSIINFVFFNSFSLIL